MTTDGILTQYSYDAANQLVTAGDRNFTYDGAGNVIAITSMEEQSYYKYDGANRLTGVTYDDETYAAYSYDAFGRMVSREVGEYDPENIKSFNEKAKIKNATPSSQNGNSSEKSNNGKANGNGNTNSNGNEKANSNDKGNGNNDKTDIPKGLIGNEHAKAYGVYKKVAEGLELPDLNIEIETFDYMGQSTNLHKVYSEHGSPMNEYYQAGGEVVAQKMFGNKGRISPAKEATLNTNGGLMYYTYDGLGTVTALHDRHGDKIEDYRYDAFGNLQTGITSPYNLQGYTGHLYDDKSSLVFMNARWYNPSVGRFMSKDTYRGDLAVPQSLNQYAYVMNNPINYVDPTGHIAVHGLSYYRGMSEGSLNSELELMGEYWWEDYAIFEKTGHWTQQQEQAHQNADNIREALQGYVYVYKESTDYSSPWEYVNKNIFDDRIEYYYTRTTTHTDIYENYYGMKYEPTYADESMTQVESASQVATRNQKTLESDIGRANTSWNAIKIVKTSPRKGESYVVENGELNRNGVITSMDAGIKKANSSITKSAINKGGVSIFESFARDVVVGTLIDSVTGASSKNTFSILGSASLDIVYKSGRWFTKNGDEITEEAVKVLSKNYDNISEDIIKFFTKSGDDVVESGLDDVVTKKIPWSNWNDYKKVTVNGQEYAQVGDRLYSKHAVDRMQPSGNLYGHPITQAGGDYGRSVAPQYVEDVISSVKPVLQENGNLSYISGSLQVITNKQGAVVTIITK